MLKICPSCMSRYEDATLEVCPHDGTALRHIHTEGDDPLIGRALEGRWRVEARIGAGGMGVVYRAQQLNMERAVAIKTLHAELARGGEYLERFLREAEIASRISHPHLVAIHDFGQTEDHTLYLVMELLEGESLGARMRRPMRLDEALEILSQACMALSVAHEAGIIHRDLKPDNIFLARVAGAAVFAKVLDFGIAKVQGGANLTQTGKIFGTPQYMSPEQWRAERRIGPASDLYALGCILYELLSGRPPFEGDSFMELFYQHMQSIVPEMVPIRDVAGAESLEALLWQLLEKDARKRPQDALEVKRRLDTLREQVPGALELPAWQPADVERRGAALGTASTSEGISPLELRPREQQGRASSRDDEATRGDGGEARGEAAGQPPRRSGALAVGVGLMCVGLVGAAVALQSGVPRAPTSAPAAPLAPAAPARASGEELAPLELAPLELAAFGRASDLTWRAADAGRAAAQAVAEARPAVEAAPRGGERGEGREAVPKPPAQGEEARLEVRTARTIQARIRAQQRTLKACYDLAIRRSQAAPGRYEVKMRLEIDEAGRVASVEALADPLPEASLGGCAREKIGQWTFGPSLMGGRDRVEQTFTFEVKAR